ncbi:MAG TPA: YggS family pyridoxal phosphate-dependent enzyme [Bacteroidales bacterium]|nr:YggS family pyridoxal phosphate-dependent enzyme [Bacteroidales bacterium]
MSISENIRQLQKEIPSHVKIIAISKTHAPEQILEVYRTGHRLFGENRAQELIDKQPLLPEDIQWHFVGHLQTNKVKYIAPYVSLIHSIDSLKLLKEVNKQAQKNKRIIDCLLQFHIAQEESKYGLSRDKAAGLLGSEDYKKMHNIRIAGVMGMATFTDDMNRVRKEFQTLKSYFDFLKTNFFADDRGFSEISMGMTGDYKVAIEEGSTMVRIGTAIFGER